jgi:hypothetical protein
VRAQKDTTPAATEQQIADLPGGTCTAENQDELGYCSLCQTADSDGSIEIGMEYLKMPCDKQHCFHAGCLKVCLKQSHFTCPLCYDETLRRAYRAKSRACHEDKVVVRHKQEIEAAADPNAKHRELVDAARLMTQDITRAYANLKDWRGRRDVDLGRDPGDQKRPPPSITHRISREAHKTGGKISIAKNRVDTTIDLPPNVPLPYVPTPFNMHGVDTYILYIQT